MENTWTSLTTKDNEILKQFYEMKAQGREIQKNFNFFIPDYVLDEIVLTQNKHQKLNLLVLINLATINKRLTEEQASELKNKYCK